MLLGGYAKIGKTFLLLDLAHNVATGGKLWGTDITVPVPAPVFYFEQEVGEMEFQRRVKMRYDALKIIPPDNLFYESRAKDFFVDTIRGVDHIRKRIKETEAKVIIVDPIGRCLLGDENSNKDIGGLFQHLDGLLHDFPEVSIIMAHHFGKPPKEDDADPLSPYNFRGASKWFDAPDTLITFAPMTPHPGEWKRLKCRFEVRQGEPMDGRGLIIEPFGIVCPAPPSAALVKPPVKGIGPRAWGRK